MATKVLITAGPTWVPIDKVRVISNTATGETGILLAEKFLRLGAKVTLLLGPTQACCLDKKIRLIRFCSFNDLDRLLKIELKTRRYDIVIHSAAVSDYQPGKIFKEKIKSSIKNFSIKLVPLKKIIDSIKQIDPSVTLVGFKFEPGKDRSTLIKEAKILLKRANLDLAVANTIEKNKYEAYIVGKQNIYGPLKNKSKMADKLISLIGEKTWKS